MTRVTAPINKLARSLASSPTVARPTYLAGGITHQHSASGRSDTEREDNRHFTMTHRPTPQPEPSRHRVVPLMQSFNLSTTTAKKARLDTSTIDYFVMPDVGRRAEGGIDPSAPVRVPLMPDNFFPARDHSTGHFPEVGDGPAQKPEIVVVAADPSVVSPASALTEIEPMGIDGVELDFAHMAGKPTPSGAYESGESQGMIRDLWKGLVEDITSSPSPKAA